MTPCWTRQTDTDTDPKGGLLRLVAWVLPWVLFGVLGLTVGCTSDKGAYEAAVEDLEPRYCYQSIGGIQCYATPYHRDEARLVNYYGPAPKRYEKPEAAPEPSYNPPPAVGFFVRDPEPVPLARLPVDHRETLPWLQKKYHSEPVADVTPALGVAVSEPPGNWGAE